MNKIGFKHFRRFLAFEPIEYSGITFLVGRNNSGKSTIVKALLLVLEYLKSDKVDKFSFSNQRLEDANIVTYDRALNKFAQKEGQNFIDFEYTLEQFQFSINITGKENLSVVDVDTLTITDTEKKITFQIKPTYQTVTLSKFGNLPTVEKKQTDYLSVLSQQIEHLEKALDNTALKKSSKAFILKKEELRNLKRRRNILAHTAETNIQPKESFVVTTNYTFEENNIAAIINHAIREAKGMTFAKFKNLTENKERRTGELKDAYANYISLQEYGALIDDSLETLIEEINKINPYYLPANPAKQSALFSIRDKNNALSQAIHDFVQLEISKGDVAYRFMEKWMSNDDGFEVGDSFTIIPQAGEAYEVIVDSNGVSIPLADKGMGSIQIMLLLFRLACIIHKTEKISYNPLVIIEEPELNLHPALQSRLADLFLTVHEKYGIDFMVETHSEYLLRKTQLLVKNNEYEVAPNVNPFSVIYFDKASLSCWKMEYRPDGKFVEKFGSGFYDETTKLVYELL
ncbi:MAG: AAA family ATPase [Bacteroidota bacterium]